MKAKLNVLQKQAKDILKKIEVYKQTHSNNVIYTYIQFQSMNGKKKFINALKLNAKN